MPIRALIRSSKIYVEPIRNNPQIGLMLIMTVVVSSGVGLVAPMLTIYAKTFAASSTLAGMVITIFGIGRLLANYPAGFLSQRYGRRYPLIVGLTIVAIGSVGAAVASSIEWLLFWRFVQGLGSGIQTTVSTAVIADLAPKDQRGKVFALQQAGAWLGISLGPGIGGLLAHHFGLSAPFWGYGIFTGAMALLVWLTLTETVVREDPQAATTTSAEPSRALLGQLVFVSLCMVYLGAFFTRTASQWMLVPALAVGRYNLGVDVIGLALTIIAITTFVTLPVSGSIIDRFGAERITVASAVVMTGGLALLAFSDSYLLFWIGLVVLGMGVGLNSPAMSALSVEIVPRARYGPGLGILRSFGDAGYMLGPVLVGLLDDFGSVGVTGGLLFNALLMGIVVAIFRYSYSRHHRQARGL